MKVSRRPGPWRGLLACALGGMASFSPARATDSPPMIVAPATGVSVSAAQEQACLTAALYYESASEPDAGQDAVAQVILNRTRNRAYPSTICGVVWQGHERRTGCQFSFTCDGSLTRRPDTALWSRAEAAARRVMAGAASVPAPTVTAHTLHYHAAYVAPAWRHGLIKVARIGQHIFYESPSAARPIMTRAVRPGPGFGSDDRRTVPPALSVWGLDLSRMSQADDAR